MFYVVPRREAKESQVLSILCSNCLENRDTHIGCKYCLGTGVDPTPQPELHWKWVAKITV